MAEVAEQLMTVAEFLAWDDGTDMRDLIGDAALEPDAVGVMLAMTAIYADSGV